jgi:(1->4)-alpha-D-glucan 1-alpha-D-glucosylmutase
VPDVYQGTELWDLSLVDPDNRRPVDYDRRRHALEELLGSDAAAPEARAALARRLSDPGTLADGRAKLLLLHAGLRARSEARALFLSGSYLPLSAEGPLAPHVFAFGRAQEGRAAVCAAPRLVRSLLHRSPGAPAPRWEGELPLTGLGNRRWRDVVTGAIHQGSTVALARLYADFPVALLLAE